MKELEPELAELRRSRTSCSPPLPNLPEPEAPDGETEEDADACARSGEKPEFGFEPRRPPRARRAPRLDRHGGRRARPPGSRFAYLLGDLVMVEMALVRFALELLRGEGFTPVSPPVLVREEALYGTGFFPGEREMIYEVPKDELFLVGTSEVSLASLHAGRDPRGRASCRSRYAGFSTCFRREAGAGGQGHPRDLPRAPVRQGRDVQLRRARAVERGARAACSPSQERILSALEIPYRVVDIPVGDLGASAARKFDCEAWIPSQERYREVTSCSNTTDYQARRLKVRYRPSKGARTRRCTR